MRKIRIRTDTKRISRPESAVVVASTSTSDFPWQEKLVAPLDATLKNVAKGTRKGKARDETTLQNKARKNEMDFVLIRIYVLYCWVRLRRNIVLNPSCLGYSAQKIAIMQAFC